jgi:hypothetical protein
MKRILLSLTVFSGALGHELVVSVPSGLIDTPAGCRALNTDKTWPAAEVWSKALPGVVSKSKEAKCKHIAPSYRIQLKSIAEVQKAVKFATEHNPRLSVINSGHDLLAINMAVSVF